MEPDELLELWQENRDRPAWILEHREELEEVIDTSDEIPTGGMHGVRSWTARYASTVTRQLRSEASAGEEDETAHDGDSGESADA